MEKLYGKEVNISFMLHAKCVHILIRSYRATVKHLCKTVCVQKDEHNNHFFMKGRSKHRNDYLSVKVLETVARRTQISVLFENIVF